MAPVYLAAVGNPADPVVFGGTPHYLLQAGLALRIFKGSVPFRGQGWHKGVRKLAWNLSAKLRTGVAGGYQFTNDYLERLWSSDELKQRDAIILNLFQLFPESAFTKRSQRWFYIDQTLRQLFFHYGYGTRISSSHLEEILQRERSQYLRAEGVIVTSEWARSSLLKDYGISPRKVHIVVRGANLDMETARVLRTLSSMRSIQQTGGVNGPLRVVFVGKDWKRKGLDRLIGGMKKARRRGADLILSVIGPSREEVSKEWAEEPWIKWEGYIDKLKDMGRYRNILLNHDVGCLLSRVEAGGICLREFHLAGLATIATDVGGCREFTIASASSILSENASEDDVGDLLFNLSADRSVVNRQKKQSIQYAEECTWEFAVQKIAKIMFSLRND